MVVNSRVTHLEWTGNVAINVVNYVVQKIINASHININSQTEIGIMKFSELFLGLPTASSVVELCSIRTCKLNNLLCTD